MEYTNSFFNLIIHENGVSMRIYPPKNGGERLVIEDVTNYLAYCKVDDYNLKAINDAITTCEEEVTIVISNDTTYPVDEYMDIQVSPDKMTVFARFFAPSDKGGYMSEKEIIRDLQAKKISEGIDEEAIKAHVMHPEFMKSIILAKGTKPIEGHDASIEYMFNVDRKAKPQLNEDGTVDFHRLNNISHIVAGDVLAVLNKEDLGTSGVDVYGNEVKPRKVEKMKLRYGNNIKISEDGTKITSMVDGHVTLDGDRVSVSNVYNAPADVDNSTGDIEYNGSVTIKGSVLTGFMVRAKGDIEIFGVVEGATIVAEGDIIIHRGISGMNKSKIVSRGNLVSKFIESANVAVGGYIETDTILHSMVSAKGDIYVRGKNGNIIGGNVRSTTLIEATCIGSPMGTTTCVEVGSDPAIMDRVNKIKKDITEKTAEKEKLTQMILLYNKRKSQGKLETSKIPIMAATAKNILALDEEISKLSEQYEKDTDLLAENVNAKIVALHNIYQGTKVTISGDYILIHDSVARCQYKKVRAEIKATPL